MSLDDRAVSIAIVSQGPAETALKQLDYRFARACVAILARAITSKKPFLPVMSHSAFKPGCRWVVVKPFDHEKPLSKA